MRILAAMAPPSPTGTLRRLLDRFTVGLVRLVLGVFLRRVEVEGGERVPRRGPLILVGNHVNGLVDPLLLLYASPRVPRFLGASVLWDDPVLRPFLALGAVIPVYRRREADPARNEETFARCHELLAAGGAIALFPEGLSHNEPALQPLKTGAARIALEAEEKYGPLGVAVVPAGLTFAARESFRSRALVRFGEPVTAAEHLEAYREDGRAAVRALTERIGEALAGETLNYDSWREARLIARAAELYREEVEAHPEAGPLGRSFALRRAFLDGYRALRNRAPERLAAVERQVEEYDALLTAAGMERSPVDARPSFGRAALYSLRMLARVVLGLPLALVGWILNWLPYRVPGWLAARFPPDKRATYKVFSAFFLFPIAWLLEAALALWWGGGSAALGVLALAPASGWIALRTVETAGRFRRRARAFLLPLTRRRLNRGLAERRREIKLRVAELAELL